MRLDALKILLRRKWMAWIAAVVTLYPLVGFLVLPAIIKWQMLKRLPALTHRAVAVRQVKLNPYALSLTLRGFTLTETNGEPFASLGELYVNLELASSLLRRGIVLKEISLKEPSANIFFFTDGSFNFSNLIPTNTAPAQPKPKSGELLPLVMIDTLSITNAALAFTDMNRTTPFIQRFGPINIRLSNFTTRPQAGSPYSIAATSDETTFAWAGDISIAPPRSAGTFMLTGLRLNKYASYVHDLAHAELTDGRVDLRADYRVEGAGDAMTFGVSNAVIDLKSLHVGVTQPRTIRAAIDKLRLNVNGLAFDSASKRVSIDALAIGDASFRFADESIEPHVAASIDDFNGSVKGLTSDLNAVAAVDFRGKINRFSTFSVAGQINPLAKDLFVDLAILLRDMALTPATPYTAKYAGYALDKGTLSLDLHYHVTQSELKAKNNVRVDQFAFGAASGSPDATKLPVKLAVALLQDRHGVIALDVPVTGRLDDPKFKLGPIIWQVFMNLISKAVTKPFALLGSMFGGGEDLDFIAFDLGTPDFSTGEINKLDALATALYERPALHLEINGSVDPAKDRQAIARVKLEQQLKTRWLQKSGRTAKTPADLNQVLLAPQDRERLLKLAYAEAMGLVSAQSSDSRQKTVLAHLSAKQNFEPLRRTLAASTAPAAGDVTPADMEKALIERAEIAQSDYAALMQERAAKVQAYLLETGKVETNRLTIAAPKTVDASFQGQSRANLDLK